MKRTFDLTITAMLAPFWVLLLLLVWLLVRTNLGRPAFYFQVRPGRYGAPFRLIKFRSMTDTRDSQDNLLPDEDRLPRFGRWLRASSLDELPELFNVLKGEMSLVGPRPLLTQYLNLYSPRQARRHEIRPGITGWAQVNGRNAVSWDEKLEMDVWYVENQSLWLDLKILARTAFKVFSRDGINTPGSATSPFFTGSGNASNGASRPVSS